jgi:putative transposase
MGATGFGVTLSVTQSGCTFDSIAEQAQRFLGAHTAIYNLSKFGGHLERTEHYRNLGVGMFAKWGRAGA